MHLVERAWRQTRWITTQRHVLFGCFLSTCKIGVTGDHRHKDLPLLESCPCVVSCSCNRYLVYVRTQSNDIGKGRTHLQKLSSVVTPLPSPKKNLCLLFLLLLFALFAHGFRPPFLGGLILQQQHGRNKGYFNASLNNTCRCSCLLFGA